MSNCVPRIALAVLLAGTPAFAPRAASFDLSIVQGMQAAATPVGEEEEIATGRELAGRILGATPLTDDPALQDYVNKVGRWIAAQSERPDLPWRFGVIDTRSFNAYAAPGGYVLVGRGLYEILDNEAQLAGVLAYAIASIARRQHLTILQRSTMVSAMVGTARSMRDARGGAVSSVPADALTEPFVRGLERTAVYEADEVGLVLAARAGYNPYGLVEVLHKLQARRAEAPSVGAASPTHPPPLERVEKLREAIKTRLPSLPSGKEPPLRPISALCFFPCGPTLK